MRNSPHRRRRVLALSACAAAMAGAVALSPIVIGASPLEPASYLNLVEGGALDHNRAHLPPSPQAVARAQARLALCDSDAERAANPVSCPADAPTPSEARTAQIAGRVSPLASTEPDGLWGPLLSIPTTAIHAIVLPTNKILYISQPKYPTENEAVEGGNAYVWDPATNTSRSVPPPAVPYPTGPDRPANLWCGGQVSLADGRVLVVGGNLEYPADTGNGSGNGAGNGFKGGKWVMTFDPWTETWTKYADMPHGRWYPTLTELPDGKVLIVGGWDETGGIDNGGAGVPPTMVNDQDVEVFDPAAAPGSQATTVVSHLPPNVTGQNGPYPDHQGLGLYPHMFVLPSTSVLGAGGDKVLVAGPTKYDSAVIDTGTWLWTDIVDEPDTGQPRLSQDRSWGTAWLEPGGVDGSSRVVLLGGADSGVAAPGVGNAPPAVGTSEVLDLDEPDAGWQLHAAPELNHGRGHFNTVLLPDGSIFSNGGGIGRKNDSLYSDPVYQSEYLGAGETLWRDVGVEADARTYHSTSVLLPDGRVASAGDDRDIAPTHIPADKRTAQLWSPPYLFDGARPVVTASPTALRYDVPFRVAVSGPPAAITRAVLIRPAAVTHSVDMAQREITLDVTAQADGLTMRAPRDATVAPPGYYMLFVLNADGVPSVASWVRIDAAAPDAPALPVTPVAPLPTPTSPSTPVPVPPPTGTRPVKKLTATVQRPTVSRVGTQRVRVRLRLRANLRSTARITVTRSTAGRRPATRALRSRTLTLKAGATARPTITITRAWLGASRSVRIAVVIRNAAGGTLIINRVAELPARR